ncbi:hypothetical protein FHX08_006289 [Rhizobium sp. BK529]|uniref:hypothetical protein n=1 Tax=unclassified Rhizobium TaxID=2613769 RepID=UPI00104ABD8F|nr:MULTISPECIES: hypothetical protein [unclassified Rhizobium]MBB3595869.1 hypothetical protein [Rhizobium sp. BK529]TCR96252.1 hypothetical protein EV281_11119 [Rhizobium sp. BK418]
MHEMLRQAASDAVAMGPAILLQGLHVAHPLDVVNASALYPDDRRTILAAWISDVYAVGSNPALRYMPGTSKPVTVDEIDSALTELDRRFGA